MAQRVARRFGKKSDDTALKGQPNSAVDGSELRPTVGNYIPLHKYNADRADAAYSAYDNRKIRVKKVVGKTFKIKDLHPAQPFVRTTNPAKLKSKVSGSSRGNISIVTHNGRHFIMDGHHEVMGAAMRGEKEITANSYHNLDGNKK